MLDKALSICLVWAQNPEGPTPGKELQKANETAQKEAAEQQLGPSINTMDDQLWGLAILGGVCIVVLLLMRLLILPILRRIIKKTRFEWDDAFVDAKCFRWVGYIAPALVILAATAVLKLVDRMGLLPKHIDADQLPLIVPLQHLAKATIAFSIMMAIGAILNAANRIYHQRTEERLGRKRTSQVQAIGIQAHPDIFKGKNLTGTGCNIDSSDLCPHQIIGQAQFPEYTPG